MKNDHCGTQTVLHAPSQLSAAPNEARWPVIGFVNKGLMPCVFLEKINLQAEISFRGYGRLLSSCLTPQKVDMQCRRRAAKAVAMQRYCQVLANYAKIFSLP